MRTRAALIYSIATNGAEIRPPRIADPTEDRRSDAFRSLANGDPVDPRQKAYFPTVLLNLHLIT